MDLEQQPQAQAVEDKNRQLDEDIYFLNRQMAKLETMLCGALERVITVALLVWLVGCHPSPFSFRGVQQGGPAAGAAPFSRPDRAAPDETGAAPAAPAQTRRALTSPAVGAAFRMIASAASHSLYGYAPSIIYAHGQYHMYYCSSGTNVLDWDHVRYATSPDLVHWSRPIELLTATPVERATCDPAVIRYDAGDGPITTCSIPGTWWGYRA